MITLCSVFFILYLRLSSSVMDFNSPLTHASLLIYSESSAAELDQYNLRLLLFLMLAEWSGDGNAVIRGGQYKGRL